MSEDLAPAEHATVDLAAVMAEIDAEVRRRRATGEFPPDLEAELDAVFARFAPPGALGDDLDALLARAEDAASIDVDAPVDSSRPIVPVVKKAIRKSTAWYQRHLATQVSALGGTLVSALRNLADRVERLERLTPGIDPTLGQVVDDLAPPATPSSEAVLPALSAVTGRVLHAEAGDGSLVRALAGAGLDAYGVDPRRDRTAAVVADGFDVRGDAPLDHLSRLPSASLGAVVLSGFVDRAPVGMQVAAFVHAARVVAPGGVVVVVATAPADWEGLAGGAVAELSPGRPLSPATWAALARRQELTVESDSPVLVARRPHR